MSLRMAKINKEILRQLTDIIQKEIDDPVVSFLSITRVETTADLQECKIYFSILDENNSSKAQIVLDTMSKFIRIGLGKRVRLRVVPKLRFFPDNSIKYSVDIYKKIEDAKNPEGQV